MAYKIIVKRRFTKKVTKLLIYLELEWGQSVANAFIENLYKRIDILSAHPHIGVDTGLKNCRSLLITKHNRIYYRIKDDVIEILNLYDTRINPERNPFYTK